ncbi:MAG: hypothetical protein GWN67_18010 [Phycisphaerae bacterium]|nr:hypothetical protein [Phycisphaerae bacterium]NIP54709.1 hypothetical protein [Phycisphaerae bacterium]NIS51831.1 hypothetical protein [Phycisphaerae bacterium]NIU10451.1 hypothetical protein [Phycisphaerae bacterium]NIU58206.1 hypothetical protein [Phycisphaerae bacterium]
MKFKGTILCLVLISVLFLCGCQTTVNQKKSEQALIKWEYAQLQHALCNENADQDSDTAEKWLWLTSGKRRSAGTLFQIYHEIAGRAPGQKNVTALLGAIGENGWELVDYSEGSRKLDDNMRYLLNLRPDFINCQTETWIFKRPKD